MTDERFDVLIFEKASRKVDAIVGVAMKRWNGTGTGRNTVELREQTVRERINDRYDVQTVPTGQFKKGDKLP